SKLRAKLGLKPLETTTVKKATSSGTKEDPVAADVINPLALRQREEIREKLAAAKEKRLLNQKLGEFPDPPCFPGGCGGVACVDPPPPFPVDPSAPQTGLTGVVLVQAKLLEEMDQEFGVSPLVEEEFQRRRRERYSARDLQGLAVEHDPASIPEGQTLVLTLKDRGVLEPGEDILEQPTLAAQERAREELELRRKKPSYVPYEEEEPGPAPQVWPCSSGRDISQHTAHLVQRHPTVCGITSRGIRILYLGVFLGGFPLGVLGYNLGSSQAVTFRKTRRRVKRLRKKEKPLRADDLLALAPGDTQGDFGSRSRGRGRRVQEDEEEAGGDPENPLSPSQEPPKGPPETALPSDDTRTENMDISSDEELGVPGSPPVLEEDEAEQELQQQLERGRRLRQLRELREGGGEKVRELLRGAGGAPGPDPRGGNIVFNATSEFCRTLGEIPTYGLAGNREEQEELMVGKWRVWGPEEGFGGSVGCQEFLWVSGGSSKVSGGPSRGSGVPVGAFDPPMSPQGAATSLGAPILVSPMSSPVSPVCPLMSPIVPRAIDDKYSRREEFRGFTQDFKEKEGYRPDVKIEYVDGLSEPSMPPQAFRQLSHRFHGKGSGKMKTERRMKKLDEEALLKKMSSSDTPLGTVALLQEKQRAQKTPYIVLSGSGKSMNA
ncbi:SNUT1 protein, partial [Scytalopus superciliaris]|nr:SNUT1 protein [Scytalopus superciliaris]